MLSTLKVSSVRWVRINSVGVEPPNPLFTPKDNVYRPGYNITRSVQLETGQKIEIVCEVLQSKLAGKPLFKCTTPSGAVVLRYTPNAAARGILAKYQVAHNYNGHEFFGFRRDDVRKGS